MDNLVRTTRIATGIVKDRDRFHVPNGRNKLAIYDTEAEARVGRCVMLAIRNVLKGVRQAQPQDVQRAGNVKLHGHNCAQERNVANEMVVSYVARFPDRRAFVCNDGTRADLAVEVEACSELYLPVQLKTANKATQSNAWYFSNVRAYKGMPVVGWRVDNNDGWVWDGAWLNKRPSNVLGVTVNGVHVDESMHKRRFDMDALVAFLGAASEHLPTWTRRAKDYLSWEFEDTNTRGFLERVTLHQYMVLHPKAAFPSVQNGSADVMEEGKKVQLKHVSLRDGRASGFQCNLHKSAGHRTRQPTYQSYAKGDFDVLVAMHVLWKHKKVLVWQISVDALADYLSDATTEGKQTIYLHMPEAVRGQYELGGAPRVKGDGRRGELCKALWTRHHFVGVQDLVAFPAEAEAAAVGHVAHFLEGGDGKKGKRKRSEE